ncbi:MAG: ribonuclease HII [Armatimonadetes bacterium]|nr:ribonuclease HII [Armatimonadota bacterium]
MDKVEKPDLWHFEREAWDSGHQRVAGVDEAGRGPLAGPVVAAAVILPSDFDLDGIRDSKTLTPAQRETAYARIVERASAVGVGIVGPETVDRLNILQATFEAMRVALADMGAPFDFVLVDGSHPIPGLGADQLAVIDGDARSASVAAASIVAKVTRDCIMTELAKKFPGYGFEKHKGYGTEEHLRAIDERGVCSIHRRSFSPVARKVSGDCPQQELF